MGELSLVTQIQMGGLLVIVIYAIIAVVSGFSIKSILASLLVFLIYTIAFIVSLFESSTFTIVSTGLCSVVWLWISKLNYKDYNDFN